MSANLQTSQTWVEALNISPEQVTLWSAEVPEGRPFLVWCMEQGHISVSEYLLWASETFGLAILSGGFFDDVGLEPDFLKTHLNDNLWSPWCFPVHHWDGVLFVACVEPPAEEPAGTRFVLADPRVMNEIWNQENQPAPMNQAAASDLEMPEDAGLNPPPLEGPIGLTLDAPKPFVLNFDESNLMLELDRDSAPAPRDPGTSVGQLPDLSGLSEPEMPELSIHLDDEEPMGDAPFLSPPTQLHVLPTTLPELPPTPDAFETPEMPEAPAAPEPTPLIIPRAKSTGASSASESEALATAYTQLEQSYQHVCLVRFNDDQIANLYRWSPSLKPPENGLKASINLGYPSFLRIVLKTGLPYHGYLVDSPAHREFFQALGLRELPGCVTAVPLRPKNSKIWGVLLAVGEDFLQAPENLTLVTEFAEPLGAVVSKAS